MGKFLEVAEYVLRLNGRPMTARELADQAQRSRHLDFCNGKTPHQTMGARISVDIRKNGPSSRFKRTSKGHFALREGDPDEYQARPFVKSISRGELVLVAPRDQIRGSTYFHGISSDFEPYASRLLSPSEASFVPRVRAETDTSLKQILSYVIVRNGESVLRFQRGKYTNVESFLKGRYSIGFGGHVKSSDVSLFSYADMGYSQSVIRELNEELRLPKNIFKVPPPMVAVLNDDSSDVGQAHIAFVHMLEVGQNEEIRKNEKSINRLSYVPISSLGTELELYEYWSRLCIRQFFGAKVKIFPRMKQRGRLNPLKEGAVAVVGSIGGGKTAICKLLESSYGYQYVSTSSILGNMLKLPPISEIGRGKMQDATFQFINSPEGPEKLARAIFEEVKKGRTKYVIDGIRNIKTLVELKKVLEGKLALIYIETNPEDAFEYYRKREDPHVSFDEFLAILSHPVEREIPYFAQRADAILYNYGSTESFVGVFEEFLKGNPV